MSNARPFLLPILLAAAAPSAFAAEPAPQPPSPEGLIITAGIGPDVFTTFPGGKSVSIWPTGYVTFHHPGEPEPFVSPDDGFGFPLLNLPWIKAGPVARFISERSLSGGFGSLSNNNNFFGLRDVGFTAEIGGFVELWPTDYLRARIEARQGVSGADGFDGNIEVDLVERYGAFTFSLGPRFQFGDSRFVNAYFSVSPGEAFLNNLAFPSHALFPYQAHGGLVSFGGFGSAKYDFSPSWSTTLFGGVNRYVDSAAESPVPNKLGSLANFSAGVIVAYSFAWKGF